MEFTIDQLSTEVLKSIFDAAFMDTGIDDDNDLYVDDDYRVFVRGMPEKDCFSYTCYIGIGEGHKRDELLESCNKFNLSYLGLKASVLPNSDGLLFQYEVLMKGGGKIEGKEIVRLFKYFEGVVGNSIKDAEVFDTLQDD